MIFSLKLGSGRVNSRTKIYVEKSVKYFVPNLEWLHTLITKIKDLINFWFKRIEELKPKIRGSLRTVSKQKLGYFLTFLSKTIKLIYNIGIIKY